MADGEEMVPQSARRKMRLLAEFGAGMVGGLVGGLVGVIVGAVIGGNVGGPEASLAFAGMRGYEATGWVGILLGVLLGGATSVYLVGRIRAGSGSYPATLAGSIAAVLVGAILLFATGIDRGDWLLNKHPLTLPTLFAATVLGGMLGFELTRQPPDGRQSVSHASSGRMRE